ncbi:ectoine hydroxylase [Actinokineospora globicatena]|uniref:ectoine hydroxylase n=1 Tax=Actinokineospora globicatena TaxID=103729 RepID=UPI0020A34D10|nr:ectoine hydroxylase [Actinokineospora globicatena]MCP2300851.1 ectoine hydroxylase [Actinokineospora globicatena]GLW77524.1 ectoine hydroxylase [Actinokineospora globicatena]GLW84358.1 ectoine hydroxylase [Actinokineospora globicatena]
MTLTDTHLNTVSRADRYPTRTTEPLAPFARTEPTVWGGLTGPIDPATLAAHDSRGYSRYDGLLSPAEVAAFRAELDRLATDEAVRADERTIVERESAEVRSIFEVHRSSELIAELVRDPRVLDRARQVLGSEVYVHQSRVNYMPGFTGKGFYWHSDFETWHAEDGMPLPRAVSMSIALTDNHPFNGGLMVMPGSQRTFVPCVGETPADHYKASLTEQEIGVPSQRAISLLAAEHGIDQFTGPAGSALLFDSNLMHGSGNNITPLPRSNIFVVFNSVENALVDPYAAAAPRPGFIAARTVEPLVR